jgi:hypothetical protein
VASASTEAAAEVDLPDLALVGRQARGRERRRECGRAVLRGRPHLARATALIGSMAACEPTRMIVEPVCAPGCGSVLLCAGHLH